MDKTLTTDDEGATIILYDPNELACAVAHIHSLKAILKRLRVRVKKLEKHTRYLHSVDHSSWTEQVNALYESLEAALSEFDKDASAEG